MTDVFSEPSSAIAATLGRSEEACRQLASRARRKLRDAGGDRAHAPADVARSVTEQFLMAILSGDEAAALQCLHPDARLVSDGGATRRAARRPIVGPANVVRLMINLGKRADPSWTFEPARVGGLPGLLVTSPSPASQSPHVEMLMAFQVTDDRISEVLTVLNPDKLSLGRPDGG